MRYIHPFPARMAPEIALTRLETLAEGQRVLDPMSGSGMVLSQAARNGFESIGYDLDPLARMISRAGATRINEDVARSELNKLVDACLTARRKKRNIVLEWIDSDEETSAFVDFWFYPKQKRQLRLLSYFLVVKPITKNKNILEILKIALSRLIVTKEPKASMARDTAHSRPHKTISKNQFDIFAELPRSLSYVLSSLNCNGIKRNTKTYLGDARNMFCTRSNSIDMIITSPPYLNAIDYMRGHRLSLVWFGYALSQLRTIRGSSIGSEKAGERRSHELFMKIVREQRLTSLDSKNLGMLDRYFWDLVVQLEESFRVLKTGATATYVIGNSNIRGRYVRNSELLKRAGVLAGFTITGEETREIPHKKRYLPVAVNAGNSLASRMGTEHIIEFTKPTRKAMSRSRHV